MLRYALLSLSANSDQWLPNQLQAVLDAMIDAGRWCSKNPEVEGFLERANAQKITLAKEVAKFGGERGSDSSV